MLYANLYVSPTSSFWEKGNLLNLLRIKLNYRLAWRLLPLLEKSLFKIYLYSDSLYINRYIMNLQAVSVYICIYLLKPFWLQPHFSHVPLRLHFRSSPHLWSVEACDSVHSPGGGDGGHQALPQLLVALRWVSCWDTDSWRFLDSRDHSLSYPEEGEN